MAMTAVTDTRQPTLVTRRTLLPRRDVVDLEVGETAGQWHVLHTRSRQEKAVARALEAGAITHYLPLVPSVTYQRSRKVVVEKPLFASYLFLYGPIDATYFAISTKRIANVIPVTNQDLFERELLQIREALTRGAELIVDDRLVVGRRVRVAAGPFQGIEGHIEQCAKPHRLILQIAVLGRSASLEIDRDLLEPVD